VLRWIGVVTVVAAVALSVYGLNRYLDDEPVTYDDDVLHFKYGSTGGERGWKSQFGFGIPYWIWVALPELFPEFLPDQKSGRGYASFGMVYEEGKDPRFDLPIGMSMRRRMGIDRVYFNCAVCHTGVVKPDASSPGEIVLGMPANTFDLGALVMFLQRAGTDWRFRASHMLPKIEALAELRERDYASTDAYSPQEFGVIDRAIFKFVGIPMMRDQLLALLGRLDFMNFRSWGPGRVDTFNSAKPILGFPMDRARAEELGGNADFPSVWNQRARKGMHLHWDGNNCSVDERNLSAGFGTGATPPTIDRDSVLRTADWLWTAQPAPFPSAQINAALAAQGESLYSGYCRQCHGDRAAPFRTLDDGSKVGEITPLEGIGTDRRRLDSYTPELAKAQGSIYAGYPEYGEEACRAYVENVCKPLGDDAADTEYKTLRAKCYPARFTHFRKTYGYANAPLDGIWLRAPYLHNGSVPNLRQLLEPSAQRDVVFYTGYPVYDYANVGFVTAGPEAEAQGWLFDTRADGNGNQGHEGEEYGTLLSREQKNALLEYLKTF
jgi:mono/diheme cytochrome c family protein